MNWPPLLLASASPRRKALLEGLGADIIIKPAEVDEGNCGFSDPQKIAEYLAELKARFLGKKRRTSSASRLILGADTVVAYRHHVLGKPVDEKDARRMIKILSGRWHQVYTGLCLYDPHSQIELIGHEMTRVKFRQLSLWEIKRYAATGEPMDKAGAYGIQGLGSLLVERIDGCYFNVMGLPLVKLNAMIQRMEILKCKKSSPGGTAR
ncbi:MAG: Maf family protein [Candidatus Edwardsbacteria bacterium]|nr:Maf family protein [Candidatus Edwardsbacteria bacterium]